MPISVEELQRLLFKYDKGVLKQGSHRVTDHEFCALEFSAIARGKALSDSPGDLPDLRSLNDAFREDDTSRTKHLLPVLAAYWDWREWSKARKIRVISAVVILTVNRIIAELPYISKSARDACLAADNLSKAAAASYDAAAAAADAAANYAAAADADSAARYAATASYAAAAADADIHNNKVLITACSIWIEAAKGEL